MQTLALIEAGVFWFLGAWTVLACVLGPPMILLDQWRLSRSRPRPEEVRAFAEALIQQHGREASAASANAVRESRRVNDFAGRRFLKEVAREVSRMQHEALPRL